MEGSDFLLAGVLFLFAAGDWRCVGIFAGGIIDADGFRLAGGGGRWHWLCDVFNCNGVVIDA